MNSRTLRTGISLLLLALTGAAVPTPVKTAVHGEYVEVRTASVFAGACHYNGERVTEGRSALLAWRIDGGSFQGVDVAGVKVFAAIACEDNLAEPAAARRSAFVVDTNSDAVAAAAVGWIKSQCADQLGSVIDVHRGAVTFDDVSESFAVASVGFGAIAIQPMPDRACCSQPELVWYKPLMPIDDRRVGYTQSARSDDAAVGPTWQRSDENSAFYGHFGG